MVANDTPIRRNAGSDMSKLILKEKENHKDIYIENINNNVDEKTDNLEDEIVIPVNNLEDDVDDEEEPSIDFYDTPELSNNNGTNENPELIARVKSHVDFST